MATLDNFPIFSDESLNLEQEQVRQIVIDHLQRETIMQCPKCHGEMEQGFVADYSMAAALVASWHPGHPEKKLVGHTKAPRAEGVPIGAYRCHSCEFLEFYAAPKFAAK